MKRRETYERILFLFTIVLGWLPASVLAQSGQSLSWTSRIDVGASLGVATQARRPFPELDGCSEQSSDAGSAALDVGLRLARWLSVEASGGRQFHGQALLCPAILVLPRSTGADTLSRATSFVGRDQHTFTARLTAIPVAWRHASLRMFTGVVRVEPTARSGLTLGGSLSTVGKVRLRMEIEHWLLPASRTVQDVFYMDAREVGRRDRVERVVGRPTFIKLGVHVGG